MADLQHDLDVDKAAAFSILMAHGRGVSSKSPDYMMEKWRGIEQCRDQMEVTSFLDVFGQRIFYKWRDAWFKETHTDNWPYVLIPDEGSDSSTTLVDEKQEAALTLRFIRCNDHSGANAESARSSFCYVQDDGSHSKGNSCACGSSPKEECPIDLHRRQAVRGFTGESELHA